MASLTHPTYLMIEQLAFCDFLLEPASKCLLRKSKPYWLSPARLTKKKTLAELNLQVLHSPTLELLALVIKAQPIGKFTLSGRATVCVPAYVFLPLSLLFAQMCGQVSNSISLHTRTTAAIATTVSLLILNTIILFKDSTSPRRLSL